MVHRIEAVLALRDGDGVFVNRLWKKVKCMN